MTNKAEMELAWGLLWMVSSSNPKVIAAKDILLKLIGDEKETKERAIKRAMEHGHKADMLNAKPPKYRECRSGVCDV